jgi:hypothetical protein
MMDKERRHQNAELQRKLKQVKPATVDEYDSAAVEAYRAKLAAEARQRQEREVAERKKWSSYLKQRIAAATDEDGNDEEKERFRKLVGSHELKRPSPMPESELRIFRSYVKAKELGDSIRKQKEEWRTQRAESESAHVSRGQKRWQKKREQQRAVQKLHSELLQERLDNGAQLKAEQERGQMRLEKELSKAAKETRRRYHEARGHDSRLDSLEEAQAAHKREEASQMRNEMERSLKEVRESELAARREQASVVRQIKTALAATRQQLAEQQAQRGQIGREEFESGRALREITEVQHLESALSNKARSAAIRASIRAKSKAVLRRKMKQAEEVRQKIAESLNSGTAYDGMMAKKQQVQVISSQVQAARARLASVQTAAAELPQNKVLQGAVQVAQEAVTSRLFGHSSASGANLVDEPDRAPGAVFEHDEPERVRPQVHHGEATAAGCASDLARYPRAHVDRTSRATLRRRLGGRPGAHRAKPPGMAGALRHGRRRAGRLGPGPGHAPCCRSAHAGEGRGIRP